MDPDIQALLDQATANDDEEASAVLIMNGFAKKLSDAVAAASSLSPADRAAITAKINDMKASAAAVGTAIAANT